MVLNCEEALTLLQYPKSYFPAIGFKPESLKSNLQISLYFNQVIFKTKANSIPL